MRLRLRLQKLLLLFALGTSAAFLSLATDPSPAAVFALVGSAITNATKTHGCITRNRSDHGCSFGEWSYGDAIINAELIAARAALGLDFRAFTDAKLDYWTATPGAVGYNLTHNISMPWGPSIGDKVGLYPIAYLARGLAAEAISCESGSAATAGTRPGQDYASVKMDAATGLAPRDCEAICCADAACKTWVFVPDGLYPSRPAGTFCWLKAAAIPLSAPTCDNGKPGCVSGVVNRTRTGGAGRQEGGVSASNADVALALGAARRYILQWPRRWADGAISRDTGDKWPGEADFHANFIWGDDAFMGLTLVSRLAAAGAVEDPLELAEFRDFAAEQHRLLSAHLVDGPGGEGLYFHGFNAADRHFSCCKWGRANGWAMMAHVETLAGMAGGLEGGSDARFNATLATFAAHAHAVRRRQPTADAADGRWHQLLNDTSTYLETSCTAMFTFAWATAVLNGWLDRATFDAPIRAAWRGLLKTVDATSGQVAGICNGFGIHADADAYSKCSTDYFGSSPGLGSVLRAARAMHEYELAA